MPRPRTKPLPTPTTHPSVPTGPDGRIVLDGPSQAMFDEIDTKWELTAPVRGMLRGICEAQTYAAACDRILEREGLVITDARGASKNHPLALLARDYRNAAQTGLHKLASHLG